MEQINAQQMSSWAADHYPRREYPMVAIGSSNGAAIHLFAALGIPWLPQTFLIPIRHEALDPDDPGKAMEHFLPLGETLLRRNPELQLHHMHDANQDRLISPVGDHLTGVTGGAAGDESYASFFLLASLRALTPR